LDKYVNIKDNLFKLTFVYPLKDGRHLISFWVNEGSAEQDLITTIVDNFVKVPTEDKEVYKIESTK